MIETIFQLRKAVTKSMGDSTDVLVYTPEGEMCRIEKIEFVEEQGSYVIFLAEDE